MNEGWRIGRTVEQHSSESAFFLGHSVLDDDHDEEQDDDDLLVLLVMRVTVTGCFDPLTFLTLLCLTQTQLK